jgi:hypothetical protein
LISVSRIPQPKVLTTNSAKWLANLQEQILHLETLENAPNVEETKPKKAKQKQNVENARKKYGHAGVKNALVNMFHGKCAYCESKITVVDFGDIEHFCPKSEYPDLTFEWSNLLFSCAVCNGASHKGTNFPLDVNGNPLLIDPTDGITDPNTHLDFAWDDIAGLANVYGRDDRGKTVENIFDLNGSKGRKELVAHRSEYVKKLLVLLRLAQLDDQEAIDLLQRSCDSSSEYSAFALVYIRPHLP